MFSDENYRLIKVITNDIGINVKRKFARNSLLYLILINAISDVTLRWNVFDKIPNTGEIIDQLIILMCDRIGETRTLGYICMAKFQHRTWKVISDAKAVLK